MSDTGAPELAAPSLNCTVPVADAGVTVALKVTDWPSASTDSATKSLPRSLAVAILCDSAGDVLGASFVSPVYAAVIVCACPTANEETDNDAFPPPIGAVPSAVVPSANCTVPVAVLGVTVAAKGTAPDGRGVQHGSHLHARRHLIDRLRQDRRRARRVGCINRCKLP